MDISVVVLTYNEEKNIQDCLKSILSQSYDDGTWEVLVIDGESCDSTPQIVKNFQKRSDRIRLIINHQRKIAPGRKLGVEKSRYPYIAFTDADCAVPKNWLQTLGKEYRRLFTIDKRIAGVGGGNVPAHDNSKFHKALGLYLNSFLGSFNSIQGRLFTATKKVNSLACLNALYSKSVLLKIGNFDQKLGNIAEDLDVNLRIMSSGYHLYYIPGIPVLHKLRSDLSGWLRNMALYGEGRAIISFKHRCFANLFYLLPVLFFISFCLTPFGFIKPIFFSAMFYFPIIFLYSVIIALINDKINLLLKLYVIFVSTHFVYAFSLFLKSIKILCIRVFFIIKSYSKKRILSEG